MADSIGNELDSIVENGGILLEFLAVVLRAFGLSYVLLLFLTCAGALWAPFAAAITLLRGPSGARASFQRAGMMAILSSSLLIPWLFSLRRQDRQAEVAASPSWSVYLLYTIWFLGVCCLYWLFVVPVVGLLALSRLEYLLDRPFSFADGRIELMIVLIAMFAFGCVMMFSWLNSLKATRRSRPKLLGVVESSETLTVSFAWKPYSMAAAWTVALPLGTLAMLAVVTAVSLNN